LHANSLRLLCYTVKQETATVPFGNGKDTPVASSTQALIGALQRAERGPAIVAAASLGRIGGPEACAALAVTLRSHADPAVRTACADALGHIGGQEAAAALILAMGDSERAVWLSAAEALMALEEDALPAVIALFQSQDMPDRRAALHGLLWLTVEHDDPEASMSDPVEAALWGWWN
jgi:HEAT repeat protein